jgi:AcrR family transcriptional regulator
MAKKVQKAGPRAESLSRDRIVGAAIALLDKNGESGLTFRALSERLSTGAGAIYWHIDNKGALMTAACDAIIARTMERAPAGTTAESIVRSLALGLFDAIDAHPWVGAALTQAPGQLPTVRVLEGLGRQVRALGVPDKELWATVGALLNYIFGVGGRNAANGQLARTQGLDRSDFLEAVSVAWSRLDPSVFPIARSLAGQVRAHDDREDFLAGIDLILDGIRASRTDSARAKSRPKNR